MLAPKGEIVEQMSGSPVDQAHRAGAGRRHSEETLLWDLIDALKAAKKDERIAAVVLDLNYMPGGGQPTLAEFTAAIKDFRSSGKKVVAHATSFLQESYYVAAAADEIYLDPLGLVAIDGYERYRTYYKDLFDKLGVEVNLFRVGAYKSAAEVYVRTDMSPEDREESLAYLNALWLSYRTAVAEARGLTPTDISDYVNNLVPVDAGREGRCRQGGARREAGHGPEIVARRRAPHGRSSSAAIRRKRPNRRSKRTRATPASRSTPPRSRTTCASCMPRNARAAPARTRSA